MVRDGVRTAEYDLLDDDDQGSGKSGHDFIDQKVIGFF
jgi:hypothetical protein